MQKRGTLTAVCARLPSDMTADYPATLSLTKHHGLGNDFLVLTDVDGALAFSREEGAALARRVCDRHRGIGADGLLLALPAPGDGSADVTMRLHNADGSVAEMSGNGVRCFVQAIVDGGLAPAGALRVATDAGVRVVHVERSDKTGLAHIRVDMGTAVVGRIAIAADAAFVIGERRSETVDVGNPHLVVAGDTRTVDLAVFGPAVEKPYLPMSHGINVEVIERAADQRDTIDMVVWERGVGITQACGTGAVASAVVANRWGMAGQRVTVRQPGGSSVVEIDGDRVTLIGPSQFVARIEIQRAATKEVLEVH